MTSTTSSPRTVVITGASSGFGAMTARALADAGHTVYAGMRATTGRNTAAAADATRYADDHAEIRYWEEARDLHDAAAVALRLWGEHRQTAGLPPWEIVGLEVIDRATYQPRVAAGYGPVPATPVGVHPF